MPYKLGKRMRRQEELESAGEKYLARPALQYLCLMRAMASLMCHGISFVFNACHGISRAFKLGQLRFSLGFVLELKSLTRQNTIGHTVYSLLCLASTHCVLSVMFDSLLCLRKTVESVVGSTP